MANVSNFQSPPATLMLISTDQGQLLASLCMDMSITKGYSDACHLFTCHLFTMQIIKPGSSRMTYPNPPFPAEPHMISGLSLTCWPRHWWLKQTAGLLQAFKHAQSKRVSGKRLVFWWRTIIDLADWFMRARQFPGDDFESPIYILTCVDVLNLFHVVYLDGVCFQLCSGYTIALSDVYETTVRLVNLAWKSIRYLLLPNVCRNSWNSRWS